MHPLRVTAPEASRLRIGGARLAPERPDLSAPGCPAEPACGACAEALLTEHDEPELSSFVPADIWYRCPLKRDQIRAILSAVGHPLAADGDEEALLLAIAKSIDHAYPHILYLRRLIPDRIARNYMRGFIEFLKTYEDAAAQDFRDAPPRVPSDWLEANKAWFAARTGNDGGRGRPGNVGDADFFKIMLAAYRLAFQREPSPSPTGPTLRFLRGICDALEVGIEQPKWPRISDSMLIAGVRQYRDDAMHGLVAAIFARCREACAPPVQKIQ